jgi:hypothetical protein
MYENMNNSSPELEAFKRAPSLGLSQWENGNLTTNLAETKDTNGAFLLVEACWHPELSRLRMSTRGRTNFFTFWKESLTWLHLFEPLSIRDLTFANRVSVSGPRPRGFLRIWGRASRNSTGFERTEFIFSELLFRKRERAPPLRQ